MDLITRTFTVTADNVTEIREYENSVFIKDNIIYLMWDSKETHVCGSGIIEKCITYKPDLSIVRILMDYTSPYSNIIYNKKEWMLGTPAQFKDIQNILRFSYNETKSFIIRMIGCSILNTIPRNVDNKKRMCFIFNPYYLKNMNSIPLDVYKLFREQMNLIFDSLTQQYIESKF